MPGARAADGPTSRRRDVRARAGQAALPPVFSRGRIAAIICPTEWQRMHSNVWISNPKFGFFPARKRHPSAAHLAFGKRDFPDRLATPFFSLPLRCSINSNSTISEWATRDCYFGAHVQILSAPFPARWKARCVGVVLRPLTSNGTVATSNYIEINFSSPADREDRFSSSGLTRKQEVAAGHRDLRAADAE